MKGGGGKEVWTLLSTGQRSLGREVRGEWGRGGGGGGGGGGNCPVR